MTEHNSVPTGEQRLRLDAERTRDELQDTLEELERRLAPKELWQSAIRRVERRPLAAVGVGLAVLSLAAGVIVLVVRRG